MDRRSIWHVGAKGSDIKSGLLSARPTSARAGDIYIVNPVALASNGVAIGALTVYTGATWTRPNAVVYVNPTITLVTGLSEKTIAQFWVRPGALANHALDVRIYGRYYTPSATSVGFTTKIRFGTATFVNQSGNSIATVSGGGHSVQMGMWGTAAASAVRAIPGWLVIQNTTSPIAVGAATGTVGGQSAGSNTASQLVRISMTLSKNLAGAFYRTAYIEARWS